MHSVILAMSASGTVMLLVFFAVCTLCRHRLKAKWKRILLLMVMAYYLIPVASLKYIVYKGLSKYCVQMPTEGKIDMQNTIYVIDRELDFLGNQRILLVFLSLSAILSALIILYLICSYCLLIKGMRNYRVQSVSDKYQKIFRDVRMELSIKKNVKLNISSNASEPITIGIFKPSIWIPEDIDTLSEKEYKYIICHELSHIKHNDLVVYFIGMLIIAIHWFNPFCYLMLYWMRLVNEQYSDETVINNMPHNDRIRYCEIMISMSYKGSGKHRMSLNFTGQTKRDIRKRIDFIMKRRKKSIFIATAIGMIGCIAGTATAFAYEAPQVIKVAGREEISSTLEEEFWIDIEEEMKPMPFNDFFEDADNQIFMVSADNKKVICLHKYVEGTRTVHNLNNKGGCVVKYYHAKRCTLCGQVVNGDIYQSIEYKVCPH